jgi:hypothetical protein
VCVQSSQDEGGYILERANSSSLQSEKNSGIDQSGVFQILRVVRQFSIWESCQESKVGVFQVRSGQSEKGHYANSKEFLAGWVGLPFFWFPKGQRSPT